jgi:hypothetical protein
MVKVPIKDQAGCAATQTSGLTDFVRLLPGFLLFDLTLSR